MRNYRHIKEIIGDCLIVAFAIILGFQFISILLTGSFWGCEDNPYILWAEIIGSAYILYIGVDRFIDDLKKNRH